VVGVVAHLAAQAAHGQGVKSLASHLSFYPENAAWSAVASFKPRSHAVARRRQERATL
jgi:hypothetical protein